MATFIDPPFKVERQGGEVKIDLSPLQVLDEAAVQQIREPLLSIAEDANDSQVSVSLKGVVYITSSMLETLIQMHRKLREGGGRLVLNHLQPQVQEVFQVTKLDDLFEIQKE
jgi:anti-anti-sigma factor